MQPYAALLSSVRDDTIREATAVAIRDTLLPALTNRAYFGQFLVTSDGSQFGSEATYPGLDAWESAGAYLRLGMTDVVLAFFDFVEASQRADGNVPFAIFPAEDCEAPENRLTALRGMKIPDDIFTYEQPGGKYPPRRWAGLFTHWQPENPLSLLAPLSYVMIASELFEQTKDTAWLTQKLPSLKRAMRYLLTQRDGNGLVGGAGFYIEVPPRYKYDGVTQCYAYRVFGELAALCRAVGDETEAMYWEQERASVRYAFNNQFWKTDHCAEYIHPDYGAVDWHGPCDVDWAAIAFGLVNPEQHRLLWERLCADDRLWWGDMPTQVVARGYGYREWELGSPISFRNINGPLYDVAAMGRVWYLELEACLRTQAVERIRQSAHLVAARGLADGGKWHERYHALQNRRAYAAGPAGYCEYAAILVRIVLGHPELFCW